MVPVSKFAHIFLTVSDGLQNGLPIGKLDNQDPCAELAFLRPYYPEKYKKLFLLFYTVKITFYQACWQRSSTILHPCTMYIFVSVDAFNWCGGKGSIEALI